MQKRTLGSVLPSLFLAYAGDATPATTITPDALDALTERLAARLGDPALGVHAALAAPRGVWGLLEFFVRTAATVDEALDALVRYAVVTIAPIGVTCERRWRAGRVVLRAEIAGVPMLLGRHANELVAVMIARIARSCMGALPSGFAVAFPHATPEDVSELAAALGTDAIAFDAGEASVSFDTAWLTTRPATADPSLHEVLRGVLDRLAEECDPLRSWVEAALPHGDVNVWRAASSLGVSVGELRTMLAGRGTTWRAFLDDTRRRLADVMLAEGDRSVSEVAFHLGYADVRAFTRAYKRWTGSVPSKARRVMASRASGA